MTELNKKPKLAVWMVTFNHEDYIAQAVESVMMQQTDFNVHLFIGEDFSSDNTRDICQSLKQKYPDQISLFLNEKNLGANKNARNIYKACFNSGAKYIAMLEGDDYWTDPLKLQKQVDFMEGNPDVSICFHQANLLMEDGTLSLHPIPQISKEGEFKYADLIKHYNFITTASVLFRKPDNFFFPKWFAEIPFGDMGLYFLISRGKKIKCLNEIMSVYRIHSQGIFQSNSILQRKMQHLQFYKIIHSSLTIEEQEISTLKIRGYIQEIASLKFSQSRFMQFIYKHYLSISK